MRSPRSANGDGNAVSAGFQTLKWVKIHDLTEEEKEAYETNKRKREEGRGKVLNSKKEEKTVVPVTSHEEKSEAMNMNVDSSESCTKDARVHVPVLTKKEVSDSSKQCEDEATAAGKTDNQSKINIKTEQANDVSPASIPIVESNEATGLKQHEEPKMEDQSVAMVIDPSEGCATDHKELTSKEVSSRQSEDEATGKNDNVENEDKVAIKMEPSEGADVVLSPTVSSIVSTNQSTGLKEEEEGKLKEECSDEERPAKRARVNAESDASTNTISDGQHTSAAIDNDATHHDGIIPSPTVKVETEHEAESAKDGTNVEIMQQADIIKSESVIKNEGIDNTNKED